MNRTSLTSRALVAVAGIVLFVATLSGCSNAPADLQNSTATRLQTGVLEVSTKAAGGDYAGAQTALSTVQGDLLTAAAAGSVAAPRAAKIQSAINLVASDLSAAIEASKPTPTPAPAVTVQAPPPADSGNSGTGSAGNGNPGAGSAGTGSTGNGNTGGENAGNGNGNGKSDQGKCKKKDDC